jgi:hypothetical protein
MEFEKRRCERFEYLRYQLLESDVMCTKNIEKVLASFNGSAKLLKNS